MISFRSEVVPEIFKDKINYSDKVIFLGSCFAENIGAKLEELKFQVLVNPFGILYNPVSVGQSLRYILQNRKFEKDDLELYNEKWISFNHHGRFSSTNCSDVLTSINDEISKASDYIKNASHLYITLGTSWVYKLKKNSQIVANCHKLPSSEFEHYSLQVNELHEIYKPLLKELHHLNADLKIIFTVSPVRHWKDGPVQNQYSKSVLIVAVQELINEFNYASYFPAYELMMDDLRDYRFYADDLFHPNQLAIDYIWDKFKTCYFGEVAIKIASKIEKLKKSMQHRVFYPSTLSYKKFIESNIYLIKELQSEIPDLSFKFELDHFKNELEKYFKV